MELENSDRQTDKQTDIENNYSLLSSWISSVLFLFSNFLLFLFWNFHLRHPLTMISKILFCHEKVRQKQFEKVLI